MITVIAGLEGSAQGGLLAENLAVLGRRSGRRVLLIDAAPGGACRDWARARAAACMRPLPEVLALRGMGFGERLADQLARHQDVLVAACACEDQESRSALLAARLVIVPIAAHDADLASHYRLIARLNAARMLNPGLQVLFVALGTTPGEEAFELARVRAYAREVMGARVAPAVVAAADLDPGALDYGACASDTAAAHEDGPRGALASLWAQACGDRHAGERRDCG